MKRSQMALAAVAGRMPPLTTRRAYFVTAVQHFVAAFASTH